MKKLNLYIGIFIAVLLFNSCSSDHNDIQNTEKIIGKWRLSQLIIDNVDQQVSECEKKMTIEVFENGTYLESDYEYNYAFAEDYNVTECQLYDLINGTWENLGNSMYKMSSLDALTVKVTFHSNKFIAEYTEEFNGITFSIKTIFIVDSDVVPDAIIGTWRQDQEFLNEEEIVLSDCDKMGTFEFLEDGLLLEKEFEYNDTSTECIQNPTNTRIWKNIGNSKYILYKFSDESEEELNITFENNKMSVELLLEEDGTTYMAKLIFIKVST